MHFLKEGQKIRAWVDPPPLIWAMPERKRFFSIEAFPYCNHHHYFLSLFSAMMIIFTLLAGERGVLGRVLLQQWLLQHIFSDKKVHTGCQSLLLHQSTHLWNRKGTLFSASTNMKGKVWNFSTCVPSPTLAQRKMLSFDVIRYDVRVSLKIWFKGILNEI